MRTSRIEQWTSTHRHRNRSLVENAPEMLVFVCRFVRRLHFLRCIVPSFLMRRSKGIQKSTTISTAILRALDMICMVDLYGHFVRYPMSIFCASRKHHRPADHGEVAASRLRTRQRATQPVIIAAKWLAFALHRSISARLHWPE